MLVDVEATGWTVDDEVEVIGPRAVDVLDPLWLPCGCGVADSTVDVEAEAVGVESARSWHDALRVNSLLYRCDCWYSRECLVGELWKFTLGTFACSLDWADR